MSDPATRFPASEFRNRVDALQAGLQASDTDALLLTSPADIFYVTGFLTRFWESPARPWFVIVPARSAPIAVIPSIGLELMSKCWIKDIRTWDAPFPGDDGVTLLADTLRSVIPENGRLGIPMGAETHVRMPLADFQKVVALLTPRRVVDATETLQRVREIKSDAEIERIRATCRSADLAFGQIADIAAAGMPMEQVFRDFQIALLAAGADWVSYVAGGAGRGGYSDVISPAPRRKLAPGDLLMLDTGAVRGGYFCDFDRNFSIGRADDACRRAYDALFQATETVLQDLRPGNRACDVHRMLSDGLKDAGATPGGGRLGHGLGITLTEWPSFIPADQTELREGMVLTIEPSVEISPGRFMVHEENIVLRENGPELLSRRAATELPVLV
ncbi:Xaa-Pro peptidase family protein [uncultured Roseobacter sp.]|uniref:M24 family metallopeptidase n=1 Tax=uncultured Roseobacter sp. TaxID=114847 RepID=UPI0026122714|nr:Xaa-Pro peptidase family protein [uncultured Roseobacter sp.]